MTRYLLNSPVLTAFGRWHYRGPLTLTEARAFAAAGPFVSAIGHAATARYLRARLGVSVPCARVKVQMQPADVALVFRIDTRLPEGHVLDGTALAALPHTFGLLERTD